MLRKSLVCLAAVAFLGSLSLLALADDKKEKPKDKPGAGDEQAMPMPGPEHDLLKLEEGEWEATIEMRMAPEAPSETSKGTQTSKLQAGGFWLISDFKGDFGGMPFHGHAVTGYDTMKKKYVSSWVDSMSPHLMVSVGDYDKAKKTLTMWGESPDPASGKMVKWRGVSELKDKDLFVWTAHYPDPKGKEFEMMKVTYKRAKGKK